MPYLPPRLRQCFSACGRYVLLVLCLLLGGSIGLAPQTFAQGIPLVLKHQVNEPGEHAILSDTLRNARIVVYDTTVADRPKQPLRLGSEHLGGLSRDMLAERIRSRGDDDPFDETDETGKTDEDYSTTEADGKIYYILALGQDSTLYESYVRTTGEIFFPGFDEVRTGIMSMGPVPDDVEDMFRDLFPEEESSAEKPSPAEAEPASESSLASAREEEGWVARLRWTLLNVGLLLVGVFIGAASAWWILTRKHNKRITSERSKNYDLDNRNSRLKHSNQEKQQELQKAKKELKQLRGELQSMEDRARSGSSKTSSHGHKQLQRRPSSDPRNYHKRFSSTVPSGPARPKSAPPPAEEKIGHEFVQWCTHAGAAMVDRHSIFAGRLKDKLPGVSLQRIFREKNAAGIVFNEEAQDAVEYWHVHVEGRDFLLPQPHRSGFRELEKCFDGGNPSPSKIESMTPAVLNSQGDKMTLNKKGHVA